MPLNIEFKARCRHPDRIRTLLRELDADSPGIDHQIDTYFDVASGRLKLRDGNVERNLIYYRRDDKSSAKRSDVWLAPCPDPGALRDLLTAALGVRCVVEKKREIFFCGQTKIHLDEVPDLGSFVEVEVIGDSDADESAMRNACAEWMKRFDVRDEDLISSSYSDMIAAT